MTWERSTCCPIVERCGSGRLRAVLIERLLVLNLREKIASLVNFQYFPTFPSKYWSTSLKAFKIQIRCPLLNFQSLEIFPIFPVFPKEKKRKSGGKLFDENGPNSCNPSLSPSVCLLLALFYLTRPTGWTPPGKMLGTVGGMGTGVVQVVPSITNAFGIPMMLLPLFFVVCVDAVFMVSTIPNVQAWTLLFIRSI